MDCRRALKLISALIDHELAAGDHRKLEAHLADCPDCRLALDDFRRQDATLRRGFARCRGENGQAGRQLGNRLAAEVVAGERPCRLLVVDDDPHILATVAGLAAPEFEVLKAPSALAARELLQRCAVDILLTDQRMPGQTGTELLAWVRGHAPQTIRLLMTGFAELDDAVAAINQGHVYHYLTKPFRPEELLHALHNAAAAIRLQRNNDRLSDELRLLNAELEQRVTERTRELEEANHLLQQQAHKLEMLALTDPLTGLLNRRAIDDVARREIQRHARYPSTLAVGLVDADHFKEVNTRYLIPGGDEALKGLARVLGNSVRTVDVVGRIGGEEFMVIAPETTLEGARVLAERIRARVAGTPIAYKEERIRLTASIGFAVAGPGVPADYEELTHAAALALRDAKAGGRNLCVVHMFPRSPTGEAAGRRA